MNLKRSLSSLLAGYDLNQYITAHFR